MPQSFFFFNVKIYVLVEHYKYYVTMKLFVRYVKRAGNDERRSERKCDRYLINITIIII